MRWLPAAVSAALLAGAAGVFVIAPVGAQTSGTISACINGNHQLTHVTTGSPLACAGQTPVSWPGNVPGTPSPSPTATSPSPTPPPTPSASPSPTSTSGVCVQTTSDGDQCGPYLYPPITVSNGYNTYVGSNCWAHPGCGYTTTVTDPGNWNTVAKEPAGNTAVESYPNVQQLYDSPDLAGMGSLSSSYAEDMGATGGTIAWAAYDVWLNNWADEVLVAVDNHAVDPTYLPVVGHFTVGGQSYTLYDNGSERVVVADSNHQSGAVDLLAVLAQVQALGKLPASNTLTAVDFGWEVCSTGGQAETFTVSGFTITSS